MTITLTIITVVLLDVAILGLLGFVMSRAAKLTAHCASTSRPSAAPAFAAARQRARWRGERAASRLHPALD